jgi:hypothetical protein
MYNTGQNSKPHIIITTDLNKTSTDKSILNTVIIKRLVTAVAKSEENESNDSVQNEANKIYFARIPYAFTKTINPFASITLLLY